MNRAAELGPKQFSWWPDWRGECAAIVASGPSIKRLDLTALRDRIHVVAIKTNIDLCPWAEVCYGCDAAWWIDRKGLPDFKGIKIFHGQAANHFKDMRRCQIEMSKDVMLVDQPMQIGNGGNSGFQALNLVVQFGAKDIVLIGFDCHDRGGPHWYGRNKWLNASNPMGSNFTRWIKGFAAAKRDIDAMQINVVNACPESEIKSFRKLELVDVLSEWGL